jgi:glycosyltransferase involved in cell wall biosynthesis
MTEAWGVSVIVVNYNNADFLGPAIDSALGQDHPLCEVIVVDDCSTDNSRGIIAQYENRVRSILREKNGGQVVATDSVWPLARYPILIFLDSDDLLFPHAAATVASVWTPETVKAQSPFVTIDKVGRQLGYVTPKFPPNLDTATIRAELLRAGGSPNAGGSANAYSRSLLARIHKDGGFDLENPREFDMDALLECNAPFYGNVITLYEPLSCYRIHDSNKYAISSIGNAHFAMKCRLQELKIDYFARRCEQWGITFDPAAARRGSVWLQECRLFAAKLPDEPLYEPIFITLCSAIRAYVTTPMPFAYRMIRIAWLSSIAAAPRTLATRLLAFRFVPGERPAWIERLLSTVANTRSWRGWLGSLRDEPHGHFKLSVVSQLNSCGTRPHTSGPDGSNDRSRIS